MNMIQTRKIGSLTEIYINGGGYYLTEIFPTFDRHFWTNKILTANDSINNYREADAAEKTAWEKAHPDGNAVPERPSWAALVEEAGAVRNDSTGYWSLNGLDDITDEEMLRIYKYRQVTPYVQPIDASANIRTNLWISSTVAEFDKAPDLSSAFRSDTMEVIRVAWQEAESYTTKPSSVANMIIRAPKLKSVIGALDLRDISSRVSLTNNLLPSLRDLLLCNLRVDCDLSKLPALSAASLAYLVANAINTAPITATVHLEVFAKLTAGNGIANLVKGANVALDDDKQYCIGRYSYDDLSKMVEGAKYRVTVCYSKDDDGKDVQCSLVSGYGGNINISTAGSHVVVSQVLEYKTSKLPSSTTPALAFFHHSTSEPTVPNATIHWAVVTPEMDDEPTAWVPAISEMTDAAEAAQAQWTLVRQLAAARDISFAEATA